LWITIASANGHEKETLMYHYGYGKPKETHDLGGEFVIRWEE